MAKLGQIGIWRWSSGEAPAMVIKVHKNGDVDVMVFWAEPDCSPSKMFHVHPDKIDWI